MMKKIVSLLLALLILCSVPVMARGHEIPQERNDCSIEVVVRYNDFPLQDGTLTAIRVGYVAEDDGNYFFRRLKDDALVENPASAETAQAMEAFYNENRKAFSFEEQTLKVQDGKVKFTQLSTGLYLIVQREAAWGFSRINTFLVGVPYMANGSYRYHVTANIKSELEPEQEPTAPPPTEPDEKLPQTGQLNWPVPLMVSVGLILFVLGWILRYGRKKDGYEK